jgi:hypothetical protein
MTARREDHTATLLTNGKVLIAGGGEMGFKTTKATAELFDPGTGAFAATGSMTTARENYTATLLAGGKVLMVGGVDDAVDLASIEEYDPATGTFAATGSLVHAADSLTATPLKDGRVLIVGGRAGEALPTAGLYDPASGKFSPID